MDAGDIDDATRHTVAGRYTGDIQVGWYGLRAEDTWDNSIRKGRTPDVRRLIRQRNRDWARQRNWDWVRQQGWDWIRS